MVDKISSNETAKEAQIFAGSFFRSTFGVFGVKKLVIGHQARLLCKVELVDNAMKRERITTEKIYVAARTNDIANLNEK